MTHATRLTMAGLPVRFVTTHEAANRYVRGLTAFGGIEPFECLPDDDASGDRLVPTVRYRPGSPRRASFDDDRLELEVVFPWQDEAVELFAPGRTFRNLLLYPLRMALEWSRQERGEYTFHASAVVRDGRAVVFAGDAEAGKTTMALSLCHHAGFALHANDQALLALRDGRPWVIHGDRNSVSLRHRSAARYSPDLAHRMFGTEPTADSWQVKRDVGPDALGVDAVGGPVPLALFVSIRLDSDLDRCVLGTLSGRVFDDLSATERRSLFHIKTELYRDLTQVIRGAAFTPMFDADLSLLDLYLPSLDQPRFAARRVEFVNALFAGAGGTAFVSLRGPLDACRETVLRLFESAPGDHPVTSTRPTA